MCMVGHVYVTHVFVLIMNAISWYSHVMEVYEIHLCFQFMWKMKRNVMLHHGMWIKVFAAEPKLPGLTMLIASKYETPGDLCNQRSYVSFVTAASILEWSIICYWLYCRCSLVDLMVEMDRLLRPEGTVVVRDSPEVIEKVDRIARAVRWKSSMHEKEPESNGREKILVATKTLWKLPSSSH